MQVKLLLLMERGGRLVEGRKLIWDGVGQRSMVDWAGDDVRVVSMVVDREDGVGESADVCVDGVGRDMVGLGVHHVHGLAVEGEIVEETEQIICLSRREEIGRRGQRRRRGVEESGVEGKVEVSHGVVRRRMAGGGGAAVDSNF
jgi:hypothetical protein